jgi:hypothetical protein
VRELLDESLEGFIMCVLDSEGAGNVVLSFLRVLSRGSEWLVWAFKHAVGLVVVSFTVWTLRNLLLLGRV